MAGFKTCSSTAAPSVMQSGIRLRVVGLVLFVQLVPKILRADMDEERKKMQAAEEIVVEHKLSDKLIELDPIGLGPFSLAIVLGILLGKVYVPLPGGASFSLGNTGGALLMGLILGHYGKIGPISMNISKEFLNSFREYGLVFFLIGAGVPGGAGFVHDVKEYGFILFVYGAIMEIIPMILGYIVASKVVKLCMLNNLGSITGGMTSTPALGAHQRAKTDDAASRTPRFIRSRWSGRPSVAVLGNDACVTADIVDHCNISGCELTFIAAFFAPIVGFSIKSRFLSFCVSFGIIITSCSRHP